MGRFVAVLLLAVMLASPALAKQPSVKVLLQQFERIAFSNEFGGRHRTGRLIKWMGPIWVRLSGPGAKRYRQEVRRQLDYLSRLTGLSIRLLSSWDVVRVANMDIRFVNAGRRGPANNNAACAAHIYDRNFVVHRVDIYITGNIPELRRHCIVEEITQSLGLANDSAILRHSIFNDWSHRQTLSPADVIMVRTLYNPRLRPGMLRGQAMHIARGVMRRMLGQRARRR